MRIKYLSSLCWHHGRGFCCCKWETVGHSRPGSETDPVPTAQQWLTLSARPDDFLMRTQYGLKVIESVKHAVKQFRGSAMCVFCLKAFGSDNSTKMMKYQSRLNCSKIIFFLVSNGSVAVWIRDSCMTGLQRQRRCLDSRQRRKGIRSCRDEKVSSN